MSAESGYGEAGGDFEYDEGLGEAEDTEAGDEGFETEADEADEADEGTFEADEADEADEAETIGEMEADEAIEADEADEGVDESSYQLSASARLRASADRNRRAAYARQMAASRQADAQRAASTQRAMSNRIKAIPITSRTRVATVGALQGAGVVTAILPNGRRTRMRIVPTVAPISEVNRLRNVVLANEKRQAAAIATNAKAVTSLANAQTSSMKQLMAQQVKSDAELSKRVVEGHNRLDARITKELSGGSGVLDKHSKRMARVLKRERRRAMMNNVLLATSTPFFLAYGDRDTPFTKDNGIIAGSTLFWLLGDDVVSSFSSNKGTMQGLSSIWSYAAPFANGGGLYWWFRNKQNQRFIAGINPVPTDPAAQPTVINVANLLKKDGKAAFGNNEHPVVASFVDANALGTVVAVLDKTKGELTLSIKDAAPSPLGMTPVNVAWIVDTKAPAAVISA